MKKCILIIFLLVTSWPAWLTTCPTCVGHVDQKSLPFFSNEFYKPDEQSMDQLYEQLLSESDPSVSDRSVPDGSVQISGEETQ